MLANMGIFTERELQNASFAPDLPFSLSVSAEEDVSVFLRDLRVVSGVIVSLQDHSRRAVDLVQNFLARDVVEKIGTN